MQQSHSLDSLQQEETAVGLQHLSADQNPARVQSLGENAAMEERKSVALDIQSEWLKQQRVGKVAAQNYRARSYTWMHPMGALVHGQHLLLSHIIVRTCINDHQRIQKMKIMERRTIEVQKWFAFFAIPFARTRLESISVVSEAHRLAYLLNDTRLLRRNIRRWSLRT
jgi:hypothetical protein